MHAMKLSIMGASGRTGVHLVREALERATGWRRWAVILRAKNWI